MVSGQDISASFSLILFLQKLETVLANRDNEMTEMLLQIFFPPLPEYEALKKLDAYVSSTPHA